MSRGPGRMMRAALAELEEHGYTIPWSVARRAAHDAACGCDDAHCQDKTPWPARSQLVSARRAIHAIAASGEYVLCRGHHGSGCGEDGRPPSLTVAKPEAVAAWQHIRAERSARAAAMLRELLAAP